MNVASRLEGLNKSFGTGIIISEFVFSKVQEQMVARPLGFVVARGKNKPTTIYELIGERDDVSAADLSYYRDFAEAVKTFQESPSKATPAFESLLKQKPDDQACVTFLERARKGTEIPIMVA